MPIDPDRSARGRTERRLRLTRLEPLDNEWAQTRRFAPPYYWAPQRWGYNVVQLHAEPNVDNVRVSFSRVTQDGANSDWRWGLVATNPESSEARYSPLQRGDTGELHFCVTSGERLFLVIVATPPQYQKIVRAGAGDGPAYPSIFRYPYMVEVEGAWPAGFADGALEDCPEGTQTLVGQGGSGTPARAFNVGGTATVRTTSYPLGWFGNGQSVSGTAQLLGHVEFTATSKSAGLFFGLVDAAWTGAQATEEVTVAPPHRWQP